MPFHTPFGALEAFYAFGYGLRADVELQGGGSSRQRVGNIKLSIYWKPYMDIFARKLQFKTRKIRPQPDILGADLSFV